ncbi:MAG: hypothetical protein ACRD27_10035 [Terracidiphilus sp.]
MTLTLVPIMWIVWSLIVVLMAGLHLYRSTLEKNEEDQIFIDDSFDHERDAQAAIVARVGKVEPFVRASHWLVVAMSVVVIAYYARNVLMQLGFLH